MPRTTHRPLKLDFQTEYTLGEPRSLPMPLDQSLRKLHVRKLPENKMELQIGRGSRVGIRHLNWNKAEA